MSSVVIIPAVAYVVAVAVVMIMMIIMAEIGPSTKIKYRRGVAGRSREDMESDTVLAAGSNDEQSFHFNT